MCSRGRSKLVSIELTPRRLSPDQPVPTTVADMLHIQRQSAYLIGRDRTVVDIPLDHPSCSKQHAVIQRTSPDW